MGSPVDTTKTSTIRQGTPLLDRTATSSCRAGKPAEYFSVEQQIAIPKVAGESSEGTAARFATAANLYTDRIRGCHSVKFTGFASAKKEPSASEVPKASAFAAESCVDAQGHVKQICKR